MSPFFTLSFVEHCGLSGMSFSDRWGAPHVFAAALTVFPGRAPANPMKIQNVLFVTFGAYALDFRLVAVNNRFEIIVGILYQLLVLSGRASFSQ
jgi:hypothetical protein